MKILVSLMAGFCSALGISYNQDYSTRNKENPIGRTYEPEDDD